MIKAHGVGAIERGSTIPSTCSTSISYPAEEDLERARISSAAETDVVREADWSACNFHKGCVFGVKGSLKDGVDEMRATCCNGQEPQHE
jgi:hypothetical protein